MGATCQINSSANSYQNRQGHLLHIYCFTLLFKKIIVFLSLKCPSKRLHSWGAQKLIAF